MAERTVVESGVIRVDASGRRQYSVEFKRRSAKMALEPGASVGGIALAHRLNANQLFKWRQDYLRQRELIEKLFGWRCRFVSVYRDRMDTHFFSLRRRLNRTLKGFGHEPRYFQPQHPRPDQASF